MKDQFRLSAPWQGALVALTLSAVGVCRAEPQPTKPCDCPPSPDEGTAFWLEGDEAMKAGHFAEAVDAWSKAWELQPNNFRLARKIGRVELRRSNWREAAMWLTRCTLLSPNPTTAKELEAAKDVALELMTAKQRISTVTVDSDEAYTHVIINDKIIRITPVLEDIYLEPGVQQIYAYNGGRATSMKLSTVAGKEYRISVSLPPPVKKVAFTPLSRIPAVVDEDGIDWSKIPAEKPIFDFRWWPVGVGGAVVGAGLVTGFGLFIASGVYDGTASSKLDAIQAGGKSCNGTSIDPRCASYREYVDKSSAFSTAATGTFIATGAVAAGVIAYMFYENHRIYMVPTAAGVIAGGVF